MQCIANFTPVLFFRAKKNERKSELMRLIDMNDKMFFGKLFIVDGNNADLQYEGIVYKYIMSFFGKKDDMYKKNFVCICCHEQIISFNDVLMFLNKSTKTITENQMYRNMVMSLISTKKSRPRLDEPTSFVCPCEHANVFSNAMYELIITEKKDKSISLRKFIMLADIDQHEKDSVVGKLVLCIHKMHTMGICHNDMHWENILVIDNNVDDKIYAYHDIIFEFNTRFVPMLFDWDHAELSHGITGIDKSNIELLEYDDDIYVPMWNEKRDWITLFLMMYTYMSEDIIHYFFNDTEKVKKIINDIDEKKKNWYESISYTNMKHFSLYFEMDIKRLVSSLGGKITTIKKTKKFYNHKNMRD